MQTKDDAKAVWLEETKRQGFAHRNWRVGRRWSGLAVALLLAGLVADLWLGSRELAMLCWIAATVSSAAMLIWFRDRRLFTRRPPASPD